jgi:hypothetical protein
MMADNLDLFKAYLFLASMTGLGVMSAMVMFSRAWDWAAVAGRMRR